MNARKPTQGAQKVRAGTPIGRTIIALAVVLVIFLALALFVVINPGDGGPARLSDDSAVKEDIAAARAAFPNVSGTAAEHVKRGHELAAEGTGAAAVKAYDEYRMALALDPDSAEALLGIAALYNLLEREGVDFKVERALTYCDAVSDVDPNDPRPYRVKARVSMNLQGYEAGADAWTRVLVLYPDDQEALMELGRCRMELGQHADAATQLEKAASLASDPTQALLLLAENHRRGRDYGDAFAALDRVPAAGRNGADAAVALAGIFSEVGAEADAREQIRLALRYDGNHSEALLQDAIYRYQQEDDTAGAGENLLRILSQPEIDYQPELRDRAALHLGVVYRLEGNLREAHKRLDPLTARDPENLPARFHQAKLALAEGLAADEVASLSAFLDRTRCEQPQMWFLLGQMYTEIDSLEGVVESFETAIELDPGHVPSYFALIHILGQYENTAEIRRLTGVLYRQLEEEPVLESRERLYHDEFDLTVLEGSILEAAEVLELENPGSWQHLALTALYYYHTGNDVIAEPLFDTIATKRHGEPVPRLYQGLIAIRAGRIADASAHFADAADRSRNGAVYLYLSGRLLEEEGRSEPAREVYARLVNYHPDHAFAHHGEARLRHRLGDRAGAAAEYRAAEAADPSFLPAWRDHLLLEMERPLAPGVL